MASGQRMRNQGHGQLLRRLWRLLTTARPAHASRWPARHLTVSTETKVIGLSVTSPVKVTKVASNVLIVTR